MRTEDARRWTTADVLDQTGKTAVITGATSGIGFETAKLLASRGATVVLACRKTDKAEIAARSIIAANKSGKVQVEYLDLTSLKSVREAAERLQARKRIDLLINNAGVMFPPYSRTEDGFELQIGTNHLGHFALTGLLLPSILSTPGSRVVTVTSGAHRQGKIAFDDLHFERKYRPIAAYAQSKLANLLFTYELQRRLARSHADAISVAAHPGWARTELQRYALQKSWAWMMRTLGLFLSQTADSGALPIVRAATDPGVCGGDCLGPCGFLQAKGDPVHVATGKGSRNAALQQRLWQLSERLTGVTYPV